MNMPLVYINTEEIMRCSKNQDYASVTQMAQVDLGTHERDRGSQANAYVSLHEYAVQQRGDIMQFLQ